MKLYTGGTFDLFHWGHENFLKQCSMIADQVVVSLNTDEFVYKYKLEYPRMVYEERAKTLQNCPYVDSVIQNTHGADSKPAILSISPNIIAIGSDWASKDYYTQMSFSPEWLQKHNIVLVYIPYSQKISSSYIKSVIDQDKT